MGTDIAYQALQMIERNRLSPTPPNYAFWYAYLSGSDPALKHAVDRALDKGTLLTEADLTKLRAAAPTDIDLDRIAELAAQAGLQADHLSGLASAARENAANCRDGLSSGARGLASSIALEDKQKLIESLVTLSSASAARAELLETQIQASQQEIEALRQQLEQAQTDSRTDPLTGLHNRKAFDQHLNMAAARAMADRRPLCVVFADIDFFKRFNDTWGHAVGDEVLKLVGRCIERFAQNAGFAARFGGEEFVISLPGKGLEAASDIAEQISDFISSQKLKLKNSGEVLGQITVSMGISQLTAADGLEDFLARADAALYLAKRTGRNRVCTELDLAAEQRQSA